MTDQNTHSESSNEQNDLEYNLSDQIMKVDVQNGASSQGQNTHSESSNEQNDLEYNLSDQIMKAEVQNGASSQVQNVKQFDTTDTYNEVFNKHDKSSFDSWEELTKYIEEFQYKSGTSYKPKSSCKVVHANERRLSEPLPERFVYSSIKLICIHFGADRKRVNPNRDYVGKGCGAFLRASCSKGSLRITQHQLVHTNHDPDFGHDNNGFRRRFQVLTFSEELDMIMLKHVVDLNPFKLRRSDNAWEKTVENLKEEDDRFENITVRSIKRRVGFLLKQFETVNKGKPPIAEDEMGGLLYQLYQAKNNKIVHSPKLKMHGRKRKTITSDRNVITVNNGDDSFDDRQDSDPDYNERMDMSPVRKSRSSTKKGIGPSTSTFNSGISPSHSPKMSSDNNLSLLVSYLRKKDDKDRHLRERELEIRERELELNKQRFEFEKCERAATLNSLKKQISDLECCVYELKSISAREVESPP